MVTPAVDATSCVVCLEPFTPEQLLALLPDGWACLDCAELVTRC